MGQFDKYVYTLPKNNHEWGNTYATPRAYFNGNDSMQGSNLRMGFSAILSEHVAQFPHFHHSVEEYYWFLGNDLTKIFDFDAEIEIWLGEDRDNLEKHVITSPSLVRIPPRFWHGPINYKRVGKPVTFSSMYFSGEASKITHRIKADGEAGYPYFGTAQKFCVNDETKRCGFCGKCYKLVNDGVNIFSNPELDFTAEWIKRLLPNPPAQNGGKYGKYIYTFAQEYHKWGATFASPRAKFRGITQMPDVNFFGGFSVVLQPNTMEVPHVHHARDEYLWFTGGNISNFFDYDAEIEIYLGWDPDKMEKIVITEPTVVRIPPDLWHCPINFKRISKPVGFLPVYDDGDWSKILRVKDDNGNYSYIYEAATLRRCVYDKQQTCIYCGKCHSDKTVKPGGTFV